MDVIGNIIVGFSQALSVDNLLFTIAGVTLGSLVGVLPGIGPMGAMSLLLGVTFGMTPMQTLLLFSGVYYGSMYGGSTTSILLNVPGESTSVITCIDGYKMTQKGRAGAALFIAAAGSFVAGTVERYWSDALCTSSGGVRTKIWLSRVFRAYIRRPHRSHQHFLRLETQSGSHGFVRNPDLHDWHGPWIRRPALYVWITIPVSRG